MEEFWENKKLVKDYVSRMDSGQGPMLHAQVSNKILCSPILSLLNVTINVLCSAL